MILGHTLFDSYLTIALFLLFGIGLILYSVFNPDFRLKSIKALYLCAILIGLGVGLGERARYSDELLAKTPPYQYNNSILYPEAIQRGTKEVQSMGKHVIMYGVTKLSEEDQDKVAIYFWKVWILVSVGLVCGVFYITNEES